MNINSDQMPSGNTAGQELEPGYDNRMYAPAAMPDIAGSGSAAFPEIYYKLQPHILMVCDQMDAENMPLTKQLMDNAGNNIHANIMRTNPEVADYAMEKDNQNDMPEARAAITYGYGPGYGPGYGYGGGYGGYRNRGFVRDLIDILLLNEYYRRRRYPYYY